MSTEIKQGHYDTITYDQVIAGAKAMLMITGTTDHDALMEYLANEAVRHLNNLSSVVPKSCVLDVEDNLVALPSGFEDLIGLRFVEEAEGVSDSNLSPLDTVFNLQNQNVVYLNYRWMQDCNVDQSFLSGINSCDSKQAFKIVDGYINFHVNVGTAFSKVQLAYSGLNVDKHGLMTMYARYERAVRSYVCGMFATRFPEKFSPGYAGNELATWKAQKRWVKGDDQEKSWKNNKYEIQKIIHSLFVDSFQ